ncbi:MAG: phosphatidate cytidylyltransferase [Anaerolineae bacterium]|nr:phosphatidate cytidylyltransferase [Anaerolineae bacterium]
MLHNDLVGFVLFIGYFVVAALLALLFKARLKVPFEVFRKMLHLVITLSILPLSRLFSTWYVAVLAAFLLVLIMYPVLALVENTTIFKRFAPERAGGEFKRSLIIVQLSFAILIAVFWGMLGMDRRYIVVVAVMAWGFGDAAAALVGKAFGRRRILHPRIEGRKTVEGTLAMFVVAGLAIFLTLLIYAGQTWYVSLTVATCVAPVCAAVELFSDRGMDTLTVPLSAAFAILPLMSLFSFLGV